ncbi:hypothetical protein, partial [Erythrobacter sp. QSSC1-22B]|uniref:hypothetical protein n=1 Tax=Erythrobacter sp. QSSC1-22B TaxID=1860125 RepID=UPI001F4217BB
MSEAAPDVFVSYSRADEESGRLVVPLCWAGALRRWVFGSSSGLAPLRGVALLTRRKSQIRDACGSACKKAP